MADTPVDLGEKLASFTELWSPKVVARARARVPLLGQVIEPEQWALRHRQDVDGEEPTVVDEPRRH